ncbi:hypothetical protein ACOSQ3_021143 [Xanthoceras sorbifolium]
MQVVSCRCADSIYIPIHAYNPDEEYAEVESQLRAHLESFLETARSFNTIYTKEIRPWTHMMEVPQLHGFGPAANRLLEAYKMLLKFLGNLRNLRDSHAALAVGSSETISGVLMILHAIEGNKHQLQPALPQKDANGSFPDCHMYVCIFPTFPNRFFYWQQFSYCPVPIFSNPKSSSKMNFGSKGVVKDKEENIGIGLLNL